MSRKLLLTIAIVGAVGALSGFGTYSAFSATTSDGGNSMQAGTVSITDDHTASSMLALTNAKPGDTTTGCIKVTYTGSLPADVRMYATPTGALAPYLDVTAKRGTGGSYPSCTGFTAETTTFTGTLATLPASWSAGTSESWAQGDSHSYQVAVTLDPNAPASAQGASAGVSFTWEARNQ
jgi:predicted ribosomally synthesized peptide with SipW-like signal peptide